jgi:hypothetical protein
MVLSNNPRESVSILDLNASIVFHYETRYLHLSNHHTRNVELAVIAHLDIHLL